MPEQWEFLFDYLILQNHPSNQRKYESYDNGITNDPYFVMSFCLALNKTSVYLTLAQDADFSMLVLKEITQFSIYPGVDRGTCDVYRLLLGVTLLESPCQRVLPMLLAKVVDRGLLAFEYGIRM